jgi:hypothetical protein
MMLEYSAYSSDIDFNLHCRRDETATSNMIHVIVLDSQGE